MEITSTSTEDTKKLAVQLAAKLIPGTVIGLYGDLGSGKTTFTRYLCAALGSESRVQSPTFVIARKYRTSGNNITTINHLDLYRLKSLQDLHDIDLDEFVKDQSALTIIEWPELVEDILPKNFVKITFEHVNENERKIHVENIH